MLPPGIMMAAAFDKLESPTPDGCELEELLPATNFLLGMEMGRDEHSDEPMYKIGCPMWIKHTGGAVCTMVKAQEGQKVVAMRGNVNDAEQRVAKVARAVVRNTGLDAHRISGMVRRCTRASTPKIHIHAVCTQANV